VQKGEGEIGSLHSIIMIEKGRRRGDVKGIRSRGYDSVFKESASY
jgi:hypothetical protein